MRSSPVFEVYLIARGLEAAPHPRVANPEISRNNAASGSECESLIRNGGLGGRPKGGRLGEVVVVGLLGRGNMKVEPAGAPNWRAMGEKQGPGWRRFREFAESAWRSLHVGVFGL